MEKQEKQKDPQNGNCCQENTEAIQPKPGRSDTGQGQGKKGRFYRTALTSEERDWLDEAITLSDSERNSLEEELALARVILRRLAGMEGGESKAVSAVLSIARLQEIRRRLEGKQANTLVAAVDAILGELGLGEAQ